MNTYSSVPFLRILPAFCLGITFAFYFSGLPTEYFLVPVTLVLILFVLIFTKQNKYRFRYFFGIALIVVFFFNGYFLTELRDDRQAADFFARNDKVVFFLATIESPVSKSKQKVRYTVNIKGIYSDSVFEKSSGAAYCYFTADSQSNQLIPGDVILFSSKPELIKGPVNPGQFDFKKYSAIHRIHHQFYIRSGYWKKIESFRNFSIKRVAFELLERFLSVYTRAGVTGQEYAVLSALVLGMDDEIDDSIMKAFSATGTLHILSVSGMHVGIIFSALSFFLSAFERKRITRLFRLIILIISLWFYALLTGLSPSVIRSATMFTFILIGRSLDRSSNMFNSMALSAFCIFLLFDTLFLFEIGLQLSFLAVGGIVYIYPRLYNYLEFRNYLADKAWSLTAVSIAAQAGTFAISIYYFHQFPNYFIISNLVIIPLSTIGIFSGIALLFSDPITIITPYIGWFVQKLIALLNASAIFLAEIPGSVTDDITIGIFEMVLLQAIVLAVIYWIESKAAYMFFTLLCLLIGFCFFRISSDFKRMTQKKMVVFSGTSSFSAQFINGFDSWLITSSKDSLKAFKLSDAFCFQSGISRSNRKTIFFDQENCDTRDIYFRNNEIVIADFHVSINSLKKMKGLNGNPDLLYLENERLISDVDTSRFKGKILISRVVNSSFESKLQKSNAKIRLLKYGAQLYELN